MGIMPLQFKNGQTRESLGLSGHESFDIRLSDDIKSGQEIKVAARPSSSGFDSSSSPGSSGGEAIEFTMIARLDTPIDVEYYRHGGILPMVLRNLAKV